MNVNVTGPFIYFEIPLFGGIPITQTTVSSLVITVLLCIASVYLGWNLKKRPGAVQVLVEKGIGMMHGMEKADSSSAEKIMPTGLPLLSFCS